MKNHIDNSSGSAKAISSWYHSAVATAIVGCVFSLIVLTLLVVNFFQTSVTLPKWEEQLQTLKDEIRSRPDDEQLLLRIRQLDLRIRKFRIRRLDFSYKGTFLLFGGVAVLLIGAKWAGTFKKKMPMPQLRSDLQDEQTRKAIFARLTVTIGAVILGLGALSLVMIPWVDFGRTGAEDASYPSMQQIKRNWHRFRGPSGSGVSAYTNIPTSWNGKTDEGILWKTKVPLIGNNSPVIWDDRVFLSGANKNKQQVYCFDAFSGELLWTGDVTHISQDAEQAEVFEYTGFAASTMTTDGHRVYAIFPTGDVICFDFEGRKVWQKNLSIPDSAYGYASSLEMYQNLLLVQYDQGAADDEKSKLIALDGFSGQIIWETKRQVANSWTTPIVADVDGQYQLITVADPWVIAYDPVDGTEIWRAKCVSGDAAPSAIYAGGLIFVIEPDMRLIAIKPDGRGDVTQTHIVWKTNEGGSNICSPVSNGEVVFMLFSEGLISCYIAKDGTKLWEKDLRENFQASPSIVGDKLYLLNEEGIMFIIEIGSEYKELAKCELDEKCNASPAFADGRIYIRGAENLYCIGELPQSWDPNKE
jgi:outer membrane protein assembly factor BamB